MNKSKLEKSIGWTDLTINPIKGMCKGGCWYCYTKPFYKMGRLQPEIRLDFSQFLKLPKTPKRIFLCSTHDLFGDWISENWRDNIFEYIKHWKQHTFQILTKMPENIDRPMPDNVHLGVSVTDGSEMMKTWRLASLDGTVINKRKGLLFVSIEPMLEEIDPIKFLLDNSCRWIILGRLTGHGHEYDPKREWIERWVRHAKWRNIPIFLKNNLKDIWGEKLIQQYPEASGNKHG